MEYPAPLIEGFKWAKEGMPKDSNPWTSEGARAAFDQGHDLAARFPRWVDAKEHLYTEAQASKAFAGSDQIAAAVRKEDVA